MEYENMTVKPLTIQTFYPTGNTKGYRIAEITNRSLAAILIPRKELEEAIRNRPELDSSGLYFLFGNDQAEDDEKIRAYIGESETIKDRLRSHNKEKEFWETAVVFVSSNSRWQLNKADIRFMENLAYVKATEAKRYALQQNIPTRSLVTESREADLEDLMESIDVLLTSLGYPIFSTLRASTVMPVSDSHEPTFVMCSRDSDAQGMYTNEGFVVFKGSVLSSRNEAKGFTKRHLVNKLIADGIIDANNVLTEDYLFKSPSTAAAVVGKASFNGWDIWKTEDGRTLHTVYRAEAQAV